MGREARRKRFFWIAKKWLLYSTILLPFSVLSLTPWSPEWLSRFFYTVRLQGLIPQEVQLWWTVAGSLMKIIVFLSSISYMVMMVRRWAKKERRCPCGRLGQK